MKKIVYKVIGYLGVYNPETKEIEQLECISVVERKCPTQAVYDANYPIAEKEAIPGTIEVTGKFDYPTVPHNILAGEYITVDGVMYKAIANIPNGESIIVGQNAVVTTIEEQLAELAKGE